jgi:hypothetical protein
MASERTRQKAIFWIGSAIVIQDARPGMSQRCPALKEYRERTMKVLSLSNVAFHAIDPSGLESLGRLADAFPLDRARTGASNLERQSDIGVLPAYTGGRIVMNTNHPEDAVAPIFRESSSYYLLGFSPGEPDKLTRRRKVEVRIARPNVEVRVRTGVYAPPPPPAVTSIERLITGPLPVTDMPMKMWLSVSHDGSSGSPSVIARIVASSVRTLGGTGATADLIAVVVDRRGKVVSSDRQQLTVSNSGDIEASVRLPAVLGEFQVRTGILIPGINAGGSVYGEITVAGR